MKMRFCIVNLNYSVLNTLLGYIYNINVKKCIFGDETYYWNV